MLMMKIGQNPFSLYDFLGYLIPGMIFGLSFGFILKLTNINIEKIFPTILSFNNYFVITLSGYLAGHILSYLSSVTVEKYSQWSLGYPSRYLLSVEKDPFWNMIGNNLFLKYFNLLNVVKFIVCLYLLPIVIFDTVLRKILKLEKNIAKPVDGVLSKIIIKNILKLVYSRNNIKKGNYDNNIEKIDSFRLVYHYVLENSINHIPKMNNYVALYGFTRTVAFAINLLFWISLFILFANYSHVILLITILSMILSFVMYLDFNKFYRKYSLEVLMALTVVNDKTDCN